MISGDNTPHSHLTHTAPTPHSQHSHDHGEYSEDPVAQEEQEDDDKDDDGRHLGVGRLEDEVVRVFLVLLGQARQVTRLVVKG